MPFEKLKFNKAEEKGGTFDHEAEKEKRKEIRKILERALTEVLKPMGFKKEGPSTWLRKIEDKIQMVYLQRSQWGHSYYLEAGVCDSKDLKDNRPHITDCPGNKRIEGIFSELEYKKYPEKELQNPESKKQIDRELREKEQEITNMLEFEIPNALEKYPDGGLRPSVDITEAQNKIESLKKVVEENVSTWLDEQSK